MLRSGLPPRPAAAPFQENAIRRPSGEKDPKSLYPSKLVRGTTLRVGASGRPLCVAVRIYQARASPAIRAAALNSMPRRIRRGRGEALPLAAVGCLSATVLTEAFGPSFNF